MLYTTDLLKWFELAEAHGGDQGQLSGTFTEVKARTSTSVSTRMDDHRGRPLKPIAVKMSRINSIEKKRTDSWPSLPHAMQGTQPQSS